MKSHYSNSRYYVVIPAAGKGRRMNSLLPKQYMSLHGKTVLEHALSIFVKHPRIEKIIVVLNKDDQHWQTLCYSQTEKIVTTIGGSERVESVLNGLETLAQFALPSDWVLVHDAVRPCLQVTELEKLIETLKEDRVGGILAVPVRDTLKCANDSENISATISREKLWQAQTPQMFRLGLLQEALRRSFMEHETITDESRAVELLGKKVKLVMGSSSNIKITYPMDFDLAEKILCCV